MNNTESKNNLGAPDDMARRAVEEVLRASGKDALTVLVESVRENIRLRMDLASVRGLCGRCGKPGAAGAAGLCRECHELTPQLCCLCDAALDADDDPDSDICRRCASKGSPERPIWAIRSIGDLDVDGDGAPLYWSNDDGWVGNGGGTAFTTVERHTLDLPVGGVWVCALCGQGDPTSPQHICR